MSKNTDKDKIEETEEPKVTETSTEETETSEEPLEVKAEETEETSEDSESSDTEVEEETLETEAEESTEEPVKTEEIVEEAEDVEEISETKDEEPIEAETAAEEEEVEEISAEELEIPEIPDVDAVEAEVEADEFEIPDIPLDVEAEDTEEEVMVLDADELAIPDVPIDDADDIDVEVTDLKEDVDIEEYGFEAEKAKPPKKKKKMKLGARFALGLFIGLAIALLIEVAFSIPVWLGGTGRPDLFYIELVLMFIAMMLPGLLTRSIQRGILGAFLIFLVSFALPLVLTFVGVNMILNPLAPIFASTDFSLDALEIFQSLFSGLNDVPFATIQKWVWIVDLVLMFIITVVVVTIGTALIKNITRRKKKVGTWIGIPLLSIGFIVFAIFTPILFSSTYGIVQASTSFLAGTAKMQDAYGVFEEGGINASVAQQTLIEETLIEANYWLDISQVNYEGLQNIGVITIASLVAGQYGPLIEAGDQLALATLAMTDILIPLFDGLYGLTVNLNNATADMADFGDGPSTMISDIGSTVSTINAVDDINELRESLEAAIAGMEAAEVALAEVEVLLEVADISGAFTEVRGALDGIDTSSFPDAIASIVDEIRLKIDDIDDQLEGFISFVTFANQNLDPTIKILRTVYHSLAGNQFLRNYSFASAAVEFGYAVDNVTAIPGIASYTPPPGLEGVFAVDITEDMTTLLTDLIGLLDPLLHEELEFALTFDGINTVMASFAAETDLTGVNYAVTASPIANGIAAETFGADAQIALDAYVTNVQTQSYGEAFSDIGANFLDILAEDFKPQVYGEMTRIMSEVVDYYVVGCEEYSLLHFAFAVGNMTQADTLMSTIIPLLDLEDPAYLSNYFNNWSITLTGITTDILTYNDGASHGTGLNEIQLKIIDLYSKTDEV